MADSHKLLRWTKQAVITGGWLYSIPTLLYIIGNLTIGERFRLIEIGNSLTPIILLPIFILLPVAFVLWRWRLVISLLPALLFFSQHYALLFTPNNADVSSEATRLRLFSFNLGSQTEYLSGLSEVILSTDAEILAFQELQSSFAVRLTEELADRYPYQALHPADAYARGVGVFSQYPITDDVSIPQLSLGGQRTQIELEDTTITLFNVHPTSPHVWGGFDTSLRSSEIQFVLEMAEQENDPVILLGDFNITDMNDDYKRITDNYEDAFRQAGTGFGLTFPNLQRFVSLTRVLPPLLRIDYIFYDEHWIAVEAKTFSNNFGSDHYPIFSELALSN